jgi:methionyl aminopeptidase
MSIIIKNAEQIEKIKIACDIAKRTLEMIQTEAKVGVTTNHLNHLCEQFIKDNGATSAILHYQGHNAPPFPKSICTSLNYVVCHGIPNDKPLKKGDIVNIDVTVIKDGFYGDTSVMCEIGKTANWAKELVKVTQECLYLGIKEVAPGKRFGDIGAVIEKHARKNGYSVVRDYCGHGVGVGFHEDPQVIHYASTDLGPVIQEGMIFTIEPMINQGTFQCSLLGDGWTVVTKDHKLSAQWEHTILVTKTGYEILTLRSDETFK